MVKVHKYNVGDRVITQRYGTGEVMQMHLSMLHEETYVYFIKVPDKLRWLLMWEWELSSVRTEV